MLLELLHEETSVISKVWEILNTFFSLWSIIDLGSVLRTSSVKDPVEGVRLNKNMSNGGKRRLEGLFCECCGELA